MTTTAQRRVSGSLAAPEAPPASSLGDLADAVPHLVWVAGEDGAIRAYNGRIADYAAAQDDDGLWRGEMLVHPDELDETAAAWAEAIASGQPFEHEHRLRMADGSYRWHLSRGVRVSSRGTGELCWYGTATDVDTGRQAEDLLRRTQSSLALAMRGAQMGWWTRDLETEVVTWSPELEELFGLPPGAFEGSEANFLERVVPEDRAAVSAAVAGALENHTDYAVEFRFRHADGSLRWMDGRGRPTYVNDRPTVLYGIGIDITTRKEAEEAVRAREERLRLAAEAGQFGLYDYDLEHGGAYFSPELLRILGTTRRRSIPTTVSSPSRSSPRPRRRRAAARSTTNTGWFGRTAQSAGSLRTDRPSSRNPGQAGRGGRSARSGSCSTSPIGARPTSSATCSLACSATSSGRL